MSVAAADFITDRAHVEAAVRTAFTSRGLGPNDIAEILRVSSQSARRAWNGQRDYLLPEIISLCRATGIALESLFLSPAARARQVEPSQGPPCEEPRCQSFGRHHPDDTTHTATSFGQAVQVTRPADATLWAVSVSVEDDLVSSDASSLASDIRWAAAEARKLNDHTSKENPHDDHHS